MCDNNYESNFNNNESINEINNESKSLDINIYQNILCWYRKQTYTKLKNLKLHGSHKHIEVGLKHNFPNVYNDLNWVRAYLLNYICDCKCCQIANTKVCDNNVIEYTNNNETNSTNQLTNQEFNFRKLQKNKIRIENVRNRNKIYECETRINLIINYIDNFTKNNSEDVIILIPFNSIDKIIKILITKSNGKINKNTINTLKINNSKIFLLSPEHFVEGFDFSCPIGVVLLNCFYSHVYFIRVYEEELLSALWGFRGYAKIVLINDNIETFIPQMNHIKNLCEKMKISIQT